jgi:hypothetical protein
MLSGCSISASKTWERFEGMCKGGSRNGRSARRQPRSMDRNGMHFRHSLALIQPTSKTSKMDPIRYLPLHLRHNLNNRRTAVTGRYLAPLTAAP